MPRRTVEPRFIKPESIHIGDTVRVVAASIDLEIARIGVVGSRDVRQSMTYYYTPKGVMLFAHAAPNNAIFESGETVKHITLLDRSEPDLGMLPLF